MPWLVTKLKDKGRSSFYRYSVEGVNTEKKEGPEQFSWSVPTLDNELYRPHPAASREVVMAVRFLHPHVWQHLSQPHGVVIEQCACGAKRIDYTAEVI